MECEAASSNLPSQISQVPSELPTSSAGAANSGVRVRVRVCTKDVSAKHTRTFNYLVY